MAPDEMRNLGYAEAGAVGAARGTGLSTQGKGREGAAVEERAK